MVATKSNRTPAAVAFNLRSLGEHVAAWRKLQRLTTADLAERAGIARDTLRKIEHGAGGVSLENTLRVLRVLGVLEVVVEAADPLQSDVGRLRVNEDLPQRVRT